MMVVTNQEKKPIEDGRGDFVPLKMDSKESKSPCCSMGAQSFCKKWWWVFLIVAVAFVVIVLLIVFVPRKSKSTADITTVPPVTVTPYPGIIMEGSMITLDNYTTALEEENSAQYQMFLRNFTNAIDAFYAGTPYESFLDTVRVSDFRPDGKQVETLFEIRLTQLDDDTELPDAHTTLNDALLSRRLGRFFIKSSTLIIL